jgi:hypothetical protein
MKTPFHRANFDISYINIKHISLFASGKANSLYFSPVGTYFDIYLTTKIWQLTANSIWQKGEAAALVRGGGPLIDYPAWQRRLSLSPMFI